MIFATPISDNPRLVFVARPASDHLKSMSRPIDSTIEYGH